MKSIYVRNILLTCSSTLALIAYTSNPLSAASTSELELQTESASKATKQKVNPDNGFTKGVEQILIDQLKLHDVIGSQITRSKEPVLPEQTAKFYDNLWFGIDSVSNHLNEETKLGEFTAKIAGKSATDLFALGESEFATAPESKEIPNKTLVLARDSESTDVKKSRSELESETIADLKKWIDTKTGQSSIDVTSGLSLSQSMVLGLKADLENVTASNKSLVREQSLNALYMLIAGNAVVEKIQSDISLLIETANKIIQLFKLDKHIKKQEAAAQNIEAQKESYRKLEATRVQKMTEKLTLFANQQRDINTEMVLLKEILRAPTASSGWWPSHGVTGKIKEAWYRKDMRSMQAVEHLHPLFTKTNVQTTLDSFKPSLTLFDTGLEEMIFGKQIEDSKVSTQLNTNSETSSENSQTSSDTPSIVDSSASQKDETLDESDDSLHTSLASSQDTTHEDSSEGEDNADGKKKD